MSNYLYFSFPDDPEPFITGVRINSPHYLCKLIITETSPRYFTLVVSQYEKMNTIYYTLRAYATCPFTLNRFPNYYKFEEKVPKSPFLVSGIDTNVQDAVTWVASVGVRALSICIYE